MAAQAQMAGISSKQYQRLRNGAWQQPDWHALAVAWLRAQPLDVLAKYRRFINQRKRA